MTMRLIVVTGGVRSGKSTWAQTRAEAIGGDAVSVVATAEAIDEEMGRRISAHQAERPDAWETIEAPAGVGAAIRSAHHATVVLDCLTVLSGTAMARGNVGSEADALAVVEAEVDGILDACSRREGTLIVVTNEVGWSVHPATALGRWFQDALGAANRRLAASADEVILMVAGLEMRLR